MSERIWDAMMELRAFLTESVYLRADARSEEPKAMELVSALFEYFMAHPKEVPAELHAISGATLEVAVVDYVASMTDRYATATFERLFVPVSWGI
jgi:dGTPase